MCGDVTGAMRRRRDVAAKPRSDEATRGSGFTLVELLVVLVVLAVLIAAAVGVSGHVMDNARASQTRGLMLSLELAIDQFKNDDPLGKVKEYRDRYRGYPADELEPFLNGSGISGSGGTFVRPGAQSNLVVPDDDVTKVESAPIRAMALSIRLHSPKGSAILDEISARYRRPPANPDTEFFDRKSDGFTTDDVPLDYFVDAWGTPLDYFAVNPVANSKVYKEAPSDSGKKRFKASHFMITKNRGKPVLVAYGPDGVEQNSPAFIADNDPTDLVADHAGDDGSVKEMIDNPLNDDNVYLDESLGERLKEKLPGTT